MTFKAKTKEYLTKSNRPELLSILMILGWIIVVSMVFYQGYQGKIWSEALVFRLDDGWCKPYVESIGKHCFGDFGLAYNRGGLEEIYVANNFAATGTPLTLTIFEIFRQFPYRFSLGLFMIAGLFSVVYVCRDAVKGLDPLVQTCIIVFCGLLTYGNLTAVDRGNHILLMIVPAYLLLASNKPRSQKGRGIMLAILIGLKFWGVIFAVPLLAKRRFSVVAWGVFFGALTYIVPIYFFKGDYFAKWKLMLGSNSSPDIAAITAPYNLSLNGLLQRSVCLAKTQTWCNTNSVEAGYSLQRMVPVILLISVLAIVYLAIRYLPQHSDLTTSFALAMPFLAIPDAAPYVTIFAIPAIAAFLKLGRASISDNSSSLESVKKFETKTSVLFMLALITTLLPLPMFFTTTNLFASSNGQSNPVFRLQYWSVPIIWSGVTFSILWSLIRVRSSRKKSAVRGEV
jgi:hypothetical protein